MCNFGREHQKYLAALCSTKYEKTFCARHSRLHFFTSITTQNKLIKWKSDFWTYATKHVDRAG